MWQGNSLGAEVCQKQEKITASKSAGPLWEAHKTTAGGRPDNMWLLPSPTHPVDIICEALTFGASALSLRDGVHLHRNSSRMTTWGTALHPEAPAHSRRDFSMELTCECVYDSVCFLQSNTTGDKRIPSSSSKQRKNPCWEKHPK